MGVTAICANGKNMRPAIPIICLSSVVWISLPWDSSNLIKHRYEPMCTEELVCARKTPNKQSLLVFRSSDRRKSPPVRRGSQAHESKSLNEQLI
jgi:hypothetical protein